MFKLTKDMISSTPYPHAATTEMLDLDFCKDLNKEFPSEDWFKNSKVSWGGRKNLCIGQYQQTLCNDFIKTSPAWSKLYNHVNSDVFAEYIFDLFDGEFKDLIDSSIAPPTLDIFRSFTGYRIPPHKDKRYHIALILLFFGDEEISEGGDNLVYDGTLFNKARINLKDDPVPIQKRITPKLNSGIIWLNTANSYHGSSLLTGKRNFVYIGLDTLGLSAFKDDEKVYEYEPWPYDPESTTSPYRYILY